MTTTERGFNLLDDPWLPARTDVGEPVELSLVDIFRRAPKLATLQGDLPTQTFALIRLLLAVLHRALDGPPDVDAWERLWLADELPVDAITDYLAQHRSRFDLFHPTTPFFQVAGLHTQKGETAELNKLIADVPNGVPFFTTRLGSDLSLSYAEAARWVVHCQAFDPSGIKSGAVDDNRVKGGKGYPIGTGWAGRLGGVMLEGANVKQTLLLNLISRDASKAKTNDLPPWEREQLGPGADDQRPPPTGPVDMFTWQARRIRLFPENGRVTRVLVCNGDLLPQQNRHTVEPMSLWRRSAPQEKKLGEPVVYMPRPHKVERTIWRGLESMLPGAVKPQGKEAGQALTAGVLEWMSFLLDEVLPRDLPVRVRAVGMEYGSNESVVDEVIDDAVSLSAYLLSVDATDLVQTVLDCVREADAAALALGNLAQNLAQAEGKIPPRPGIPDPASVSDRTRSTERAYGELYPEFRLWLSELNHDTDIYAARTKWHKTARTSIRRLANELQRRISPAAWVGRTVNGHLLTATHAMWRFDKQLNEALYLAKPTPPAEQAS